MKSLAEKITYILLGAVLTLGGVGIYQHVTSPDLVVRRQHIGDSQGVGENRLRVDGIHPRAFYRNHSRGYESSKTPGEMMQSVLEDIKTYDLYKQAGIAPSEGIKEIRVEIRK